MSAFQKIASFQKIGNAKLGGNVADYFCTPDGEVLHLIAGPVGGPIFLREARWVNETYQLALLEKQTTPAQLRAFFRKAHLERLTNEHSVNVPPELLPQEATVNSKTVSDLFAQNWFLNNQAKVHLLLAAAPLARIENVYQSVFESLLNERVTTQPVAVLR